ncbi:hypothetical protein ACHQM5_020539 [Ranunculus cassubicifolius]
MDGFCYVDSQILEPQGMKNQVARKRLSDITNTTTHLKSLSQDEKLRPYSFATKEYIEKLQKENVTLRQLLQESTHVLQERNKLIELTGIELTKMRISCQKLQQQNRLLAQTNSQMTMERTLDKDRIRVMQHELACRGALLAVKDTECQLEDVKKKRRPKACMVQKHAEVAGGAVENDGDDTDNGKSNETEEEPLPDHCADTKPNRSRRSRIQSSESSAMNEQVNAKEKPQDKRKSIEVKSGSQVATEIKSDSKRHCLRRQSARFSSEKAVVPPLDERNDATKFSQQQSDGEEEQVEVKKSCSRRQSSRFKSEQPIEDKFDAATAIEESCSEQVIKGGNKTPSEGGGLRTSIGGSSRPLRRAVEKVQSYKEIPVNLKMRRP